MYVHGFLNLFTKEESRTHQKIHEKYVYLKGVMFIKYAK